MTARKGFLPLFLRHRAKAGEATGRKSNSTRDETRTRMTIGRGILSAPPTGDSGQPSAAYTIESGLIDEATATIERRHLSSIPASIPEPIRSTDAEMQDAFASLCERCDVAFHLPGDRFCASCRRQVDAEFAGVPT